MNERDAFLEALEQPTPEARAAYLEGIGRHNPTLRAAVETLLLHHKDDTFLETPALQRLAPSTPAATPPSTPPTSGPVEQPGDRVGPYKLLEKIGEGGVGIVFLAEQQTPFRRRVALKILKPGMDTRAVIARFESERQALALMDHPNIARVLDAGTTPTGRPFFVLELVPGLRITDYCERHRLPIPDRLRLFLQVCAAIQHAHQKGILHRDIKPSNVLVTLHNGAPQAKVIDFGIAKALDQPLTNQTLHTELRSFLGTPAYMSPEQADLASHDLDTRTDIYSLGVLLYELLIGHTPFDEKELTAAGLDSLRRILREQEPPPPSRRFLSLPRDTQSTLAAQRRTDPHRLLHLLRGDLDWITLKALEKDRTRRYATAHELARDIERHLAHEPVLARPPSTLYRLQKLIRRHRLVAATTTATAAALLIGFSLTLWQSREKSRAYERALQAEREQTRLRQEAETARREAEARAHIARLSAYAADMNLVQQALAANNLGRARELLDRHRPAPRTHAHPALTLDTASPDLRGWEWRHLWQLCQSDALFTLCQLPHEIESLAVSHDGRLLAIAPMGNQGLRLWDLHSRTEYLRLPPDIARPPFAFSPVGPILAFTAAKPGLPKPPREEPPTETSPATQTEQVRLWNWEQRTYQIALPIPGHLTFLAFSRDGQHLLTVADGVTFTIWNLVSRSPVTSFSIPWPREAGRPILGPRTAVTPDLRRAAQALGNGRVRVLDLEHQRVLWTARVAEENLVTVALSPDGRLLATAGGFVEATVQLWHTDSGRPLARLEGHRTYVRDLLFWPDGLTLASASGDQTIHLWDLTSLPAEAPSTQQPPATHTAAESSTSDDPIPAAPIELRPRTTLRGHKLEVWALALCPDRATLVSGAKDGQVCVWDITARPKHHARQILPIRVRAWTFPTNSETLLTLDDQGHVTRWTGSTFQWAEPLLDLGPDGITDACFSPDGSWIATASRNGNLAIHSINPDQNRELILLNPGPIRLIGFIPGTHRLLTYDPRSETYQCWDLIRREIVWEQTAARFGFLSKPAIAPDGTRLLVPSPRDELTLVPLTSGNEETVALPIRQITAATLSPDGRWLAAVSLQGSGILWDRHQRRTSPTFHGFLQGAHSVTFSPDGRRLAIGSNGAEAVKLWDAESLQELITLPGEGSMFQSIAFSHDGRALAACNSQGKLHLWYAPTFEEIARIEAANP